MSQRILVTGGQGFVGRALAAGALSKGYKVRVSSRQKFTISDGSLEYAHVGDLGPTTDWFTALQGIDAVVHCAGRAHVMKDTAADALAVFRTVNLEGTLNLARQAVKAGVKRYVFISSIGVNGLQTTKDRPFSEADQPNPHNAYALSKWEAEQGLQCLAAETGLEVVIIRPPMVYGYNAPGNFGALMRAVRRGWPLPLGAVHNRRSLVALDNLVDLIVTCLHHPAAANQTFLVSDGEDISVTELLKLTASAMGIKARLIPVPISIILASARLLGKGDVAKRLCGDLQVDISKARKLLNWLPPYTLAQGLHATADEFHNIHP